MEYKVSRVLWETLESVLLAQSKKYIAELAKCLDVNEKELIQKVLPSSDALKVYIQDSSSDDNKCKAFIQNNSVTEYCRKPVAYGSEFCCIHRENRMMVIPSNNNDSKIQKIKDRYDLGKTWIKDNNLINSSGDIIGKINKDNGTMKLFVMKN